MNRKKWLILVAGAVFALFLLVPVLSAARQGLNGYALQESYNLSTDSNFFGEPENTTPVDIDADYAAKLATKKYVLAAETDSLELYYYTNTTNPRRSANLAIAVHDKVSGYTWYSYDPDRDLSLYSGTSLYFLTSGVVLEYFNLDNILVDDSKLYTDGNNKNNVTVDIDPTAVAGGFKAHVDFVDYAISFDVEVAIAGSVLSVKIPMDSLLEEDVEETKLTIVDGKTVETTVTTSYRVKAFYLFPYFGSGDYGINGYSMIPDGSGALVRYTDQVSSTAYAKRIYGADEGMSSTLPSETASYYIRGELTATMPVYGVNHGYHQAAFLACAAQGSGNAEIHSYPYGYNSWFLNTTFFKFLVRERYQIRTSSNASDSFQLVGADPYPGDLEVQYRFLSGTEADYSGMAWTCRDLFGVDGSAGATEAAVGLTLLGLDYKGGLFGKNYVPMTNYADVSEIVSDLLASGVPDLQAVYLGWNRGGYYDNTPVKPVPSSLLGGKAEFREMVSFLQENGVDLYLVDDPLVSFSGALGSGVVKKITLSPFATEAVVSSLFANTYFRSPSGISGSVTRWENRYADLGITALSLTTVGSSLFSYREDGVNHYRTEALSTIVSEMAILAEGYQIGLTRPNAYLWGILDAYYQAPVESNKYAYVTDSIPFVELVLAGSAELFSSYVNYVSDYDLFALRLIEYGVEPAFLLTMAPTTNLRYTNSQYIYTSEYALWKDVIVGMGTKVASALGPVAGTQMTSHRYLASGVAETLWDNGVAVYVNYGDAPYALSAELEVPANGYRVVMPE